MSDANVIEFLRTVAVRADVLDSLKVRSKDEVIAAAAGFGFPFTEPEFNSLIWGLEARLAEKRGENVDQPFSLWETMCTDLIPGLEEAGLLPQPSSS